MLYFFQVQPYSIGMQLKASNPYSKSENPIAWHGWECGFLSAPNTDPSQSEIAFYGDKFQKAFYRGQGAQIVKNYEITQ